MKPNFTTLYDLYVVQQLTGKEIGNRLGTSQQTVSNWLKEMGIPSRDLRNLDNRGISKPSHEELKEMYVNQRLTTRQIASRLNVVPTSVKNWLREYDIERRPANNGLIARGQQVPTKEELIDLVHIQHLSFKQIAQIYSVDYTAITYWLNKYEIPHPKVWDTRYKGNNPTLPTKEELQELYESGMSLDSIGKAYGVSDGTIKRLCQEFGIFLKLPGFDGGKRYLCEDGHAVLSVYEQKVDNWLYQHGIKHAYEPRLPFDKRSRSDFLANGWYIEVWGITQNKIYTERRKRKTQGYKLHNLPLIEIELSHFDNRRHDLWARRLQKVLEPTHLQFALIPPEQS